MHYGTCMNLQDVARAREKYEAAKEAFHEALEGEEYELERALCQAYAEFVRIRYQYEKETGNYPIYPG